MRCAILALLAVGSISAAGSGPAAAAPVYPYCFSLRDAYQCEYSSYGQCMATASGIGGECIVNPIVAFAPPSPQPPPTRRDRRTHQ